MKNGLSADQKNVLQELASNNGETLDAEQLLQIAAGQIPPESLSLEEVVYFVEAANLLYRAGEPLIDDSLYDFVFIKELKKREPAHPFLGQVEPEPQMQSGAKTVTLPARMLSTEKAYDFEAVERWAKRLEKGAKELKLTFNELQLRATPKLDGYAAYDDGKHLFTRGDGRRGTDITRAFDRGLRVAGAGKRGQGPGEIVVNKSYFESHLAAFFDNSRNFQASLIKEKELEPPAAEAIASGNAVFYPFADLPGWTGTWEELAAHFEEIVTGLWGSVDYDIDGVVFEILDPVLREHMGATRHHHRWQIAYKRNTEIAEVTVLNVVPQTSRSGRVNPVAEIKPTRLSGALIQRATAHHYQMVREKGIGPGAVIRLSRSGEVIPKIEEVVSAVTPQLPVSCPSCGGELFWESDYMVCVNVLNCPAQITNSIEHFFKVLGNIDGFGPSSIKKIYEGGIQKISEIYTLKEEHFESFGFGPKQAENMVAQLQRSLEEPIEDWRFLAAFGVKRLGMGNSEKLLRHFPLEQVLFLKAEQLVDIKGFSDKIAKEIVSGLVTVKNEFEKLYQLGFSLDKTALFAESGELENILGGKVIVFTGTMRQGSRDEMKKQAKSLGAKVGSSITGKTSLLVCGEKVGAAKINKANELGVQKMTEAEYFSFLAQIDGKITSPTEP